LIPLIDQVERASTFRCSASRQDHARPMQAFDKVNNNDHQVRAHVIFAGNYRSRPGRRADRLSPARALARSRPVSIDAIRASIVAGQKNCHRLRGTSPQNRSQGKPSPEEIRSSLLPLKPDKCYVESFAFVLKPKPTGFDIGQRHRKISAAFPVFRGKPATKKNRHPSRIVILLACSSTKLDHLRRSDRVAGVLCLAADDRCKIRRSGSAGWRRATAAAAAH